MVSITTGTVLGSTAIVPIPTTTVLTAAAPNQPETRARSDSSTRSAINP